MVVTIRPSIFVIYKVGKWELISKHKELITMDSLAKIINLTISPSVVVRPTHHPYPEGKFSTLNTGNCIDAE